MENYRFRRAISRYFLRFLSLVVFCWFHIFQAGAQTLVTVRDASLRPIANATVTSEEIQLQVITDSLGVATLDLDQARSFTVSRIGYFAQRVTVRPNENKQVILPLAPQDLGAVEVEGFLEKTALNNQAGGIAKVDLRQLQRFSENSLVQAINTVPGVRFEERAGASYRVSIRGSSLRSPFGVRNVKVYWNGIPFTEPGGNTFLNLLDLANVASVEIIKGPAASIYGAGNGGVLKLSSTNHAALSNATSVSLSTGSFGRFRYTAGFNTLTDKSSITLKWAHQQSDGYRQHNEMDRKVFEFDGLFFPDTRRTISTSFLFSDLFYEIPGGLNPEQRAQDPTQPRPNSVERNASVDNQLFLARIGHEYRFSDSFENNTNVSVSFNQFENPFILDYKKDNQQVFALRSEFVKGFTVGEVSNSLAFGTEYQSSFFDGKNFGNVAGEADTIRFADEVRSRQSTTFANLSVSPTSSIQVTAGVSFNTLTYDIDRLIDQTGNDPTSIQKQFDNVWSQRLAVTKTFNSGQSLSLSVSSGFSPPTTTEVRTNEGGLNISLQGERGTNYELNFRGKAGKILSYDLAIFHLALEDVITTLVDRQGVQLFRNAGEVDQNGVELQLAADWPVADGGPLAAFRSALAYTYHDFEFKNYIDNSSDFSGNALPGTAPHVVNFTTDVSFINGLYGNLTYHYSDPIPLNDENNVFSRAYSLVNLRAGYRGKMSEKTNFELYFGVDNLFNVTYSLGNDLNAFGRRYFQPAPEINYYLGLKLKFNR